METKSGRFDMDTFLAVPIIGIIRNMATSDLPRVLEAFAESGLHTVEITMNSPEAALQIRQAVEMFGSRLNIGAGTVRHVEELERALEAGAGFIVTPNVDEEVIAGCNNRRIPIIAGALTPTEIYQAHRLGAGMIKVFPASVMGPGYFKSLKGPLESVSLVATGGIDEKNLLEYRNAGASGFGIGSTLFNKEKIALQDWEGLRDHMKKYVEVVSSVP